ncbi:MAG: oligosaccharide flippase family protein [bacterium]|nr:oligosaccharide flippase family protein [bacterium]
MAPSLRQRLLTGGAWVLAGRLSTSVARLFVGALLARLLTDDAFGAYGQAFSLVLGATLIAQLGLHQAAVRLIAQWIGAGQPARAKSVVRVALRYTAIGIVVLSIVMIAGGLDWLVVGLWDTPALAPIMWAIAAWVAVMALQILISEFFRGFKDLSLASIYGGVISVPLTALALWVLWQVRGSATLLDVVLVTVGATAISVAVSAVALRRKVAGLGDEGAPIGAGVVFGVAGPWMVIGLTHFSVSQLDLWVLAAHETNDVVGVYFAAARLVTVVSMPLSLVNLIVPPYIADLYFKGERVRLQRVLRVTASVAGLPAVGVLLAFILFGGPIMALVYTEPYRAGATVLALLSVGHLLNVWTGSCGITMGMTGHQNILMGITTVSAVVSLVGCLIAAPRYGALGVASVVCATTILQNLVTWAATRWFTGMWTHAALPSPAEVRSILLRR